MSMWSRWVSRRRWRRQPPREGWVMLLDSEGRVISDRIPVVLKASEPGEFTAIGDATWRIEQSATVAAVRVIDADGKATDKPVAWKP